MAAPLEKVPGKAWVVTFAGTAINLCLGILYAWSVWGGSAYRAEDCRYGKLQRSAAGYGLARDQFGLDIPEQR